MWTDAFSVEGAPGYLGPGSDLAAGDHGHPAFRYKPGWDYRGYKLVAVPGKARGKIVPTAQEMVSR
jgi:hypothetical protein